MPDNGRKDRNV